MNQTTLKIICILLIFIITFIFVSKVNNKSEFFVVKPEVNSVLRNEYGDESCSILNDNELTGNAKMMAKQYIETNRIKTWKPLNESNESDSISDTKAFCYVNNDLDNNAKDYILSNRSCNIKEDVFNKTSFITNVYEDNKPDKTNQVAVNKCVIEIDKNKLNTQSLQNFWDNVGSSDCIQLNKSILELNEFLKSKSKKTQDLLKNLEQQIKDQNLEIDKQNNEILSLTKKENNLEQLIKEKSVLYEKLMNNHNVLKEQYNKIDKTGKDDVAKKSQQLKQLNNELDKILRDVNSNQISYNKIRDLRDKQGEKLNRLYVNRKVLEDWLNYINKKIKEKLSVKKDLVYSITQREAEIGLCQDDKNTCNLLFSCKKREEELQNTINLLESDIRDKKNKIQQSQKNIQNFFEMLKNCKSQVGRLDGLILTQLAEIERLKSIKVSNCDIYIQKVNELERWKQMLLQNCKRVQDNNNKNINRMSNNMENVLINLNKNENEVQRCNNIRERAKTESVPVQDDESYADGNIFG